MIYKMQKNTKFLKLITLKVGVVVESSNLQF